MGPTPLVLTYTDASAFGGIAQQFVTLNRNVLLLLSCWSLVLLSRSEQPFSTASRSDVGAYSQIITTGKD